MRSLMRVLFVSVVILLSVVTNTVYAQTDKQDLIKESNSESPFSLTDQALYQKIDQLLMIGFRGTRVTDDSVIAKILKETNLGGVILFDYDSLTKSYDRNIVSPDQLQKLTSELQEHAHTPLFIGIDEEGGAVNRLKRKYGFSYVLPRAKDLGSKRSSNTLFQSKKLARELKVLGINLNFAPDTDLDYGTKSPIIGIFGRAFSSRPAVVTAHARAFIDGHNYYGIGTVIKHFPGHGSARGDTHEGLVDATRTYELKELEPFQSLIADGSAKAVMVAHLMNNTIDSEYPASLSKKTVTDLLRTKLGFSGVVVTDDLDMGAIREKYGAGDAAVLALLAGDDLLVFSNNIDSYDDALVYQVRDAIFAAVQDGRLPLNRVLEAYNRVMEWKAWLSIIQVETLHTTFAGEYTGTTNVSS